MKQQKLLAGQLEDEATTDYIKYLTFQGLGPTRVLNQAYKKYYETTKEVTKLWIEMAAKYHWDERALTHDKAK